MSRASSKETNATTCLRKSTHGWNTRGELQSRSAMKFSKRPSSFSTSLAMGRSPVKSWLASSFKPPANGVFSKNEQLVLIFTRLYWDSLLLSSYYKHFLPPCSHQSSLHDLVSFRRGWWAPSSDWVSFIHTWQLPCRIFAKSLGLP